LTYAEAARALGCSVSTVRRRVRAGKLPCYVDGGLRRIREDDLQHYVLERIGLQRGNGQTPMAGRTLPKGSHLWD
jgi:excisionase family DNA binding protein